MVSKNQTTQVTYEPFNFMPGHTIEAIIRLKNSYVKGEKLKYLVEKFNEKNGSIVPKIGHSYQIPVLNSEDF